MVITIADDLVAFGQVRQVAPQYRRTSTRARTSFLIQTGGAPHARGPPGPDVTHLGGNSVGNSWGWRSLLSGRYPTGAGGRPKLGRGERVTYHPCQNVIGIADGHHDRDCRYWWQSRIRR